MKKWIDNLLHPKKTKFFWCYIVVGILLLILGIWLMPVWSRCPDWVFWKNWGRSLINIIIGICIIIYLVCYLLGKIRQRANGAIKVLTIIEFVLLALIALGCIIQQFKSIIPISGAAPILGFAFWCRGVIEIFRAYYHQHGNNERYPVWWLAIAIFFVSFGVYLMVARPNFDLAILWILVILILLVAIILIVDGVLAKPASTKTKEEKKAQKSKKKSSKDQEKDQD